MSPRRSSAAALGTRSSILAHGLGIASVHGLDGLTIGRLAAELAMSKSGVLGHFGDKMSLQLAVVERAGDLFWQQVWEPVAGERPGLPRLRAVCRCWIGYLAAGPLPGGCLFTAAAAEFDDRPGPVRDAVAGYSDRWQRELRSEIDRAVAAGDLTVATDADQLVFDLIGVMLALHARVRLHHDPAAAARAQRAVDRLLTPTEATAGTARR
jgi:AcrR family transcriptional regulator